MVVLSEPQPVPLVTVKVIVAEPAETPYTTPVAGLTVATPVALLLHAPVPPLNVLFDKPVVEPTQTDVVPVIVPATGNGLTVILIVAVSVPQLLLTP